MEFAANLRYTLINTALTRLFPHLPKWAQTKFREHLKNLKRQGRVMPTFKDVVNFLNDWADVANDPFFSNRVSDMKTPKL